MSKKEKTKGLYGYENLKLYKLPIIPYLPQMPGEFGYNNLSSHILKQHNHDFSVEYKKETGIELHATGETIDDGMQDDDDDAIMDSGAREHLFKTSLPAVDRQSIPPAQAK